MPNRSCHSRHQFNFHFVDITVTEVSITSLQTGYVERSLTIICNITISKAIGSDLSILNYYWNHKDKIIKQGMFNSSDDGTLFTTTFEITSVQPSNAGVYQCSAGIVGDNTITSNTTRLCVKGIIIN